MCLDCHKVKASFPVIREQRPGFGAVTLHSLKRSSLQPGRGRTGLASGGS